MNATSTPWGHAMPKDVIESYYVGRKKYLQKALKRGWISCKLCGKSAIVELHDRVPRIMGDIDIHHIQTQGAHPELRGCVENLVPLCSRHHHQLHQEGLVLDPPEIIVDKTPVVR